MSQVLAPNSIHAEMQSVSLHSPHAEATADLHNHSDRDENSDPNEVATGRWQEKQHLELQPLQKQTGGTSDNEMHIDSKVIVLYFVCTSIDLVRVRNAVDGT